MIRPDLSSIHERFADIKMQERKRLMYAIMGITGRVGAALATNLLQEGQKVRGIVREKAKAAHWEARGVELAVADYTDPVALEAAFDSAEGVFVMMPPYFTPAPGFPEAREVIASLRQAFDAVRPGKAVYLSSVGAQHSTGLGLITQSHLLEQELGSLPISNAFLRAAWFMENFQWDIESARKKGQFTSFLNPLERQFPMVATSDLGRTGAKTLQEEWRGNRFLEIEGPWRYSSLDVAVAFSKLLKHPVQAVSLPREKWPAFFEFQGTAPDRTAPRIEMLEGFNSGLIDFEGKKAKHFYGRQTLEETLGKLV